MDGAGGVPDDIKNSVPAADALACLIDVCCDSGTQVPVSSASGISGPVPKHGGTRQPGRQPAFCVTSIPQPIRSPASTRTCRGQRAGLLKPSMTVEQGNPSEAGALPSHGRRGPMGNAICRLFYTRKQPEVS